MGGWQACRCIAVLALLCLNQSVEVDAVVDTECDHLGLTEARFFEGSCYAVTYSLDPVDHKDWAEAEADCGSRPGGSLATVPNIRVQEFIEGIVTSLKGADPSDMDFWIGYSRTPGSSFHWQEAGAVANYSKWLLYVTNHTRDEPEMLDSELCVVVYHSPDAANQTTVPDYAAFTWGDEDCSEPKSYICKYPPNTKGSCQKSLMTGEYGLSALQASNAAVVDVSTVNYATLGTRADVHGYGAWTTTDINSLDYYIEIDLTGTRIVQEIWTQGRDDPSGASSEWVRSYTLAYGDDGMDWVDYKEWDFQGQPTVLKGNDDRDSISKNKLKRAIVARHVRIYPLGYSRIRKMEVYSMRVEIIGCRLPSYDYPAPRLSTSTPTSYRVTEYSTASMQNPVISNLPQVVDGILSTGHMIPTEDQHPAWTQFLRFALSTSVTKGVVTVKVDRSALSKYSFDCARQDDIISERFPVVFIHSDAHPTLPDDSPLDGEFSSCDFLRKLQDPGPVDTCEFLCDAALAGLTTFRHVFVDVGHAPEKNTWNLLEVEVYDPIGQ